MKLKLLINTLLLSAFAMQGFSQNSNAPQLPTLPNWQVEKFALPPEFAAGIPVKGTEDVRFSPEWGKKHTDGYWTYCFLWTLEQTTAPTKNELGQYLHDYYTGLVISNLTRAKVDLKYALPVKVELHRTGRDKSDRQTYEGQVKMLDYMTQDPITLNFRIHVKNAGGKIF